MSVGLGVGSGCGCVATHVVDPVVCSETVPPRHGLHAAAPPAEDVFSAQGRAPPLPLSPPGHM